MYVTEREGRSSVGAKRRTKAEVIGVRLQADGPIGRLAAGMAVVDVAVGGAAATATAAVAWRRMLRDFPLPLWRRPNAGRSILARQWLLRRRRRGICGGGGVAVVGLLGCLAAFHSVSQLVSPSNLGSAYYYCSGAKGDSSKANLVNKQLQRKNLLCDEKSSLCCGFAYPKTTTCYYRVVRQ